MIHSNAEHNMNSLPSISSLFAWEIKYMIYTSVAGPGFPIGGDVDPLGGRGPLTWALFAKNVCENERIWSRRGGHVPGTPPP